MAAAKLGDARCPLCGGTARVSLSKSGYAVMTMNCCNAQLFTRSPRSDELVRDLIRQEPSGPARVIEVGGNQGRGNPPAVSKPSEPAPVRTAPAPAAPVRTASDSSGFGLLSGWLR